MIIKYLLIVALGLLSQACVNTDFISDPPIEKQEGRLQIQSSTQSLLVNESVQFQANAYDDSDRLVEDVIISWSSSNNEIVSINQGGVVNAIQQGQVLIYASAIGFKTDSTVLSVVDNVQQLASINVTPGSAQLDVGQMVQFTAEGLTTEGNPVPGITFHWGSSDPSILTIDNSGLATAQNPGIVVIFASADGIQSQNISVQINDDKKTGTFTPSPGSNYNVGGSVELVTVGENLVVNFGSDFHSSSGPNLHVYLSPSGGVGAGSIDIGALQSTSGAQTYNVPAGYELNDFNYVIVHCVPFNVTFGQAFIN